jgi:NifB/MoaA-like Fe-S oxidoreductase
VGFLYPSDEWYLLAGKPVPSAEAYDGLPQLENGIGLVRGLVDNWRAVKGSLASGRCAFPGGLRVTLISGTLIAPILRCMVDELSALAGLDLQLIPTVNQFFGPTVTVSGLLTGQDVLSALRGRDLGDVVTLPRAMFDALGERTLDDWTPGQLGKQLGIPLWLVGEMGELVGKLCRQ